MASLLVLALSLGAGLLLRGRLDPAPLTLYVLNVALPALALVAMHRATGFSTWAVGSVWLVFVAAAAVFATLGRLLGWDRATVGCLVLTCGLSNTSFVGFPLLEVLVGPDALPLAVPLDLLGSFLLVCTLAPMVGALAARQRWSPGTALLQMAKFPALWAMVVGLTLPDALWPAPLVDALDRLAGTLTPVALVAVGAQLRLPTREGWGPMAGGLVYKLAVAPLLALGWMALGDADADVARVAVLEAAMAPMVTGAMLATSFGLRPGLAAALVGVGVPLSLATVWAWSLGLG